MSKKDFHEIKKLVNGILMKLSHTGICVATRRSPAPEANEDLAKAKFYIEMADAKNAPASDVKYTDRLAAWNAQSKHQ